MGKRINYNDPGHLHELTFSTNDRIPIFADPSYAQLLTDSIFLAENQRQYHIVAFAVMPDHVHLLMEPKGVNYQIATILSAVKLPASRVIARKMVAEKNHFLPRIVRTRPDGRVVREVWERGGGYDRNLFGGVAVLNAIAYIHRNPVKANLCEHEIDWRFSSARAYAGEEDEFGLKLWER